MAFPSVNGTPATSNSGADVTSFTPTLPASIAAGEGLLVFVGWDTATTTASVDATSTSGWVKLSPSSGTETNSGVSHGVFWNPSASGSDSLVIALSVAERINAVAYRISGHLNASPTYSVATASSTTPDPPSHAHAGSPTAEDVLWFSSVAANLAPTVTSGPSGYSTPNSNSGGETTAACYLQANGASENPGTWLLGASRAHVVSTLSVRPSSAAPVNGSLTRTISVSRSQTGTVEADVNGTLSRTVAISRSQTGTVEADVEGSLTRTVAVSRTLTGTVAAAISGSLTRTVGITRSLTGTVAAAISGSLSRTIGVSRSQTGTVEADVNGSLTRTISVTRSLTATVQNGVNGTLSRTVAVSRSLTGTVEAAVNGTLARTVTVARALTGTVASAVSATLARTLAITRSQTGTVEADVEGSLTRTIAITRDYDGSTAVATEATAQWTLVLPAETRTLTLAAETRTITLAAETRTITY